MPRGPTANWNRHQYKKAAMLVYVIAARAGSRGNVGKLSPSQGAANPIKRPAFGNSILRFPDFLFCDAKTGVGQDTQAWPRRFNSAFASRTLNRKLKIVNRKYYGSRNSNYQSATLRTSRLQAKILPGAPI
jgi:hypothetical protein